MNYPDKVKIVDVGPRDGLQNEAHDISTSTKVELVDRLTKAGLQFIEAAAFVSPMWVPKMADSGDVMAAIERRDGVVYSVLTPNMKGFEAAVAAKADEVAVFGAASETFSNKNINCSIEESLQRFVPVCDAAEAASLPVRGYISCVLGCPYEGEVPASEVARVAKFLWDMGCHEISLGDTIGKGTPAQAQTMIDAVAQVVPMDAIAVHFHDTYGQALANILAVMEQGVAVIDASVSGLGGCPYAKGASGNVATEDVLYMLDGLGVETGISLDAMVETGAFISAALDRLSNAKVTRARTAGKTAA
jgi:hydroxymethylglutaryl-CoA lyase